MRGRRPETEQWPLALGHSQNRSRLGSQQRPAPVVRERKTPEQVRSDASTNVSRLQAALKLESALLKAQKQAEKMPVARQIEVSTDFITRAKKRMIVADKKVRLAQVALQDAKDEEDYDVREVSLAESRLERFQEEFVPVRQTPPVSSVSEWEAEVQRMRSQLAQTEVTQTPNVGRHPFQSSTQAADMLRERAAKRRAGVSEPIPTDPQDSGCQTSTWSCGMRSSLGIRSRPFR